MSYGETLESGGCENNDHLETSDSKDSFPLALPISMLRQKASVLRAAKKTTIFAQKVWRPSPFNIEIGGAGVRMVEAFFSTWSFFSQSPEWGVAPSEAMLRTLCSQPPCVWSHMSFMKQPRQTMYVLSS